MPATRTPRPRSTSKVVPAGSDTEFTFKSSKGDITVPSLASVEPTFGIIEAVKSGDNLAVIVQTVKNCADEKTLATVRELRMTELADFYEKWSAFSGIGMGESAAS